MLSTKQYLKKFRLDSDNFNRDAFLNELEKELHERINTTMAAREKMGLGFEFNIFQHIVREVQDKFNQISNRRNNVGFNENLFSAFFAKAVIPIRAKLFPEDHKRITEARTKKEALEPQKGNITRKQDQ